MKSERGQSFVEVAIFMPIFILIIVGIVEMGFFINKYIDNLSATRESARFLADLSPFPNDPRLNFNSPFHNGAVVPDCDSTNDFYLVGSCFTEQNLTVTLHPENGYDDLIITAWQVIAGNVTRQLPLTSPGGWSRYGNQESLFTAERISAIYSDAGPQQGIVIIEVFAMHSQVLAVPPLTMFIPEDIGMHVYTIMPNPATATLP